MKGRPEPHRLTLLPTTFPVLAFAALLGCSPVATTDPAEGSGAQVLQEPETASDTEADAEADAETEAEEETGTGTETEAETAPERCWAPGQQAAAGDNADSPVPTADAEAEAPISGPAQGGFETPCPDVLTPEFIASLQRALAARDYFVAPVTGEMDKAPRAAIASYQADLGLKRDTLSVDAARRLGLIAVERPDSG